MGWGLTKYSGQMSNNFQVAAMQPVRKIVKISSEGSRTCQGDSGGPLICKNKFAGIMSFKQPCATGREPDVG
jgi:secreted trypsin-like serine protease